MAYIVKQDTEIIEPTAETIKVYVDLDEHKSVIKVFSDYFEKPKETSINIDEGLGDKYKHAQGNYFEKTIYIDGKPRYFMNGEIIEERSLEELEQLYPTPEPQPTQLDRIEESIKEINATLSGSNEYKVAYETLTDGAEAEPLAMRKHIQALFINADSTSIVNAEPFVDEWKAGTMEQPIEYKIGDVRKENGQVYECKQAHTHHGEVGWNPSTFKAGWIVKHTKDTSNPKSYIQPQGAHDAYMKDEVALATDGFVYKSLIDNNVWEPTSYPQGWQKVE